MKKITDIQGLLEYELQDLYSAESQIIEALPKMEKNADHKDLKQAFQKHLEQTKKQRDRLEQIAKKMNCDIKGHTCKAMEGLIKEGQETINMDADAAVRDAAMIAAAQRIEHYEIAAYGAACYYAKMLNKSDVEELLGKTLEEEKDTDELLNDIAISKVNKDAQGAPSGSRAR